MNLNCILAQRLVKAEDGSRIAAVEVMVNTPYISKLIRDGNFHEIKAVMEKGGDVGMKTFDQSLLELYNTGKVSLQAALINADSSSELEWKINFGGTAKETQKMQDDSETLEFPDSSTEP
jgi:twitching motility protein PilU